MHFAWVVQFREFPFQTVIAGPCLIWDFAFALQHHKFFTAWLFVDFAFALQHHKFFTAWLFVDFAFAPLRHKFFAVSYCCLLFYFILGFVIVPLWRGFCAVFARFLQILCSVVFADFAIFAVQFLCDNCCFYSFNIITLFILINWN